MGPGAGAGAIGKAIDMMKVLIVYDSTYGNVFEMAQLVAEGCARLKGPSRSSVPCRNSFRKASSTLVPT
jgi:flavorubredoxin